MIAVRSCTRDARGFTLIELVVTLAVVALVLALVLPTGSRQRANAELATSAREMAAALRLTRSRAILADRPALFFVDVRSARYRPAGATISRALPPGVSLALTTAAEEVANDRLGAIRFNPDGSSTGGGLVLSRGYQRIDVLVDWFTGNVAIHDARAATSR